MPRAWPLNKRIRIIAGILLPVVLLGGCAAVPPSHTGDICSIFREKDDWYAKAKQANQRWGAPIPLQMAIINHESSFIDNAKPARVRFLGIPLWRPSSAFGYCQAKDETWQWYMDRTGNSSADRDDFEDATDFIAWYMYQTQMKLGVRKNDAYQQYLAYHEGQRGFLHGTWRNKPWLQRVARQVAATAWRYEQQLKECQEQLELAMSY